MQTSLHKFTAQNIKIIKTVQFGSRIIEASGEWGVITLPSIRILVDDLHEWRVVKP